MYRQSGKNLFNTDISSTCPHNMVNFGLLTAEIRWRVWGTLAVGISQTLQHWTEGATYIWQGDHHVGHWPTTF